MLMAEIRRSPVEVGSVSHYLHGFIHPRWLAEFRPSTAYFGTNKKHKTDITVSHMTHVRPSESNMSKHT